MTKATKETTYDIQTIKTKIHFFRCLKKIAEHIVATQIKPAITDKIPMVPILLHSKTINEAHMNKVPIILNLFDFEWIKKPRNKRITDIKESTVDSIVIYITQSIETLGYRHVSCKTETDETTK